MAGMPASGFLIERYGAGRRRPAGRPDRRCSDWSWPGVFATAGPQLGAAVGPVLLRVRAPAPGTSAMNVEGAVVERLARPQHHAALPCRLELRHLHRRRSRSAGRGARRTAGALHYAVPRPGGGGRSRGRRRGFLPSGDRRRGPDEPATAELGLAGAAHAGDRADGAGLHPGRGRRQRLAGARRSSTGTTPATGSASSASPCSWPR